MSTVDELSWLMDLQGNMAQAATVSADAVERLEHTLRSTERASRIADDAMRRTQKGFQGPAIAAKHFDEELQRVHQDLLKLKSDPSGFRALVIAQRQLGDARRRMEESTRSSGDRLMSVIGGLGLGFGVGQLAHTLTSAGEAFLGLIKEAATAALDIGKNIVKESAGRQRLESAFRANFGNDKEAGDFLGFLAGIQTEFDDDEIAKAILPAVRSGFRGQQLNQALIAALDVAFAANEGIEGVSAAVRGFERVLIGGHVDARVLREFGVSGETYYKNLTALIGGNAKSAKKQIEEGKVKAETLLSVLFQTIAQKEGGRLGEFAFKGANDVTAKLHKLGELPSNFAKAFRNSEGFARFDALLGRLLDGLDPDGPGGRRIIAAIERVFDRVLFYMEQLTTEEGIDKLITGFERAVGFAETLVDMLKAAADLIGTVASAWAKLSDMADVFDRSKGNRVLTDLYKGFADGTVSQDDMVAAINKHGDTVINAYKAKFQIQSPSRVMRGIGEQLAAGLEEGISGGEVNVGAPQVAARAAAARVAGAGGGPNVNIELHVHAGANADAEEIAVTVREELLDLLPRILDQAMERMAVEEGEES